MRSEDLARFLDQGLSTEQIGKQVGLHASTVGYWVEKHGLEAVHRDRHLPRGGLDRDELEKLVNEGLTQREIAAAVERSIGTVRHWLGRYGLDAEQKRRRQARADARRGGSVVLECVRDGVTQFVVERSGRVRCLRCRSEAVARRRRKVKEVLVGEAGGTMSHLRVRPVSRSSPIPPP